MKKILILIVFNVICYNTFSQINLIWAKQFKGSNNEVGTSVAVDGSGNVYTTGYFDGTTDFDPGTGTANLTSTMWDDIFVSKLDASGNLVWAKKFDGNNDDYGQSIAVDASGNVYVTGFFSGTVDFDPGTGTSNLTAVGNNDIFIVKLTSSGALSWAKQIGGTLKDEAYSLKLDNSSNVIITGTFAGSVDFDPNTGTSNLVSVGSQDIFILKLSSAGNLVWAKSIGSTTADNGMAVTTNSNNDIFVTGDFSGSADFDPSTTNNITLAAAGGKDLFVLKLDASGNFAWAKNIGSTTDEDGYSIATDASSNVIVTGYFNGTVDFDPSASTSNLTSQGYDIFILKLSSTGGFIWADKVGGASADYGKAVSADASGNIFVTGYFNSTADFDPGSGTSNLTTKGQADIFLLKLNSDGTFNLVKQFGGTSTDQGLSLFLNSSNVYLTGFFSQTVDFDPNTATVNLTAGGLYDTFILKLGSSTGVNTLSTDNSLTLYPNPSNGKIYIKADNNFINEVKVFDIFGNEVYLENNIRSSFKVFDFNNFNNGIYLIIVSTENRTFTKKIIIQK